MTISRFYGQAENEVIATGTTVTVDLPASIAAGDMICIPYTHRSSLTVPSGYTQTAETAHDYGPGQFTGILYRVADGSESSTTVTLTQSASGRMLASCAIYRSTLGSMAFGNYSTSAANGTADPIAAPTRTEEGEFVCVSVFANVYQTGAGNPPYISGTGWAIVNSTDNGGPSSRLAVAEGFFEDETSSALTWDTNLAGGSTDVVIGVISFLEDAGSTEVTGSGTPAAGSATASGTATRELTSSGTPSSGAASVAGSGTVGTALVASGTPAASAATVSGTAVREITASGTPSASAATVSGSGVVDSGAETIALDDDFDSAIGTNAVTNEFTSTPTITITPYDPAEVTGWLTTYTRDEGVSGKTPGFALDFTDYRGGIELPGTTGWGMVWRYTDDATNPGDGRPRAWSLFDNNSGDPAHTFSNSSPFASDAIEVAVAPRWRYLDTQRAIAYVATSEYASELPSAVAFGGADHVYNTVTLTSGANNSVTPTTLNQYGIKLDDTSVSPEGADKLNFAIVIGQHSSEDQANHAAWSLAYYYIEGEGTLADWFRQHCRLFLYDANPAGRYYGAERWTQEQTSDEDPNRAWVNHNSEQINALQDALAVDVGRVDILLDYHGSYRVNNTMSAEYGMYSDDGVEHTAFLSRFNSISAYTMGDVPDAVPDGSAQTYGWDELSAQFSATFEFGIASPGGYPDMDSQYIPFTEDAIATFKAMVENDEIDLISTTTTGSGAVQAQSASASGSAVREVTGSGAPASQSSTTTGTAERTITGSGTPESGSASVSGAGQTGLVIAGSGAVQAQSSTTAGSATRVITGSGTCAANDASCEGSGANLTLITGSGTPQAQSATASGVALRVITGSGACTAQSASCLGYDEYQAAPDKFNVLKETRRFNVLNENRIFKVAKR